VPVFQAARNTPSGVKGEYGYDTANVDRNNFGATLVEDLFRLFQYLRLMKVNAAPRKRGRIFFVPNGISPRSPSIDRVD
jgi:hypothetical protein